MNEFSLCAEGACKEQVLHHSKLVSNSMMSNKDNNDRSIDRYLCSDMQKIIQRRNTPQCCICIIIIELTKLS